MLKFKQARFLIRQISHVVFVLLIFTFGLAAQTTPDSVVRDLYRANKVKDVAEMSKTQLKKYFDNTLAEKYWKVANGEDGIDFEILYDAQDTEIKNFQIGKYAAGRNGTGWVPVTFLNFGQRHKIEFQFARRPAGWRITDIRYDSGYTLVKTLNQTK